MGIVLSCTGEEAVLIRHKLVRLTGGVVGNRKEYIGHGLLRVNVDLSQFKITADDRIAEIERDKLVVLANGNKLRSIVWQDIPCGSLGLLQLIVAIRQVLACGSRVAVGISGQRGDDLAVVVGLAIHIDGQLIAADDVHGHAGQRRTGIGFVQASVGVQLIDLHTAVDFDILLGVFVAAVQPPAQRNYPDTPRSKYSQQGQGFPAL